MGFSGQKLLGTGVIRPKTARNGGHQAKNNWEQETNRRTKAAGIRGHGTPIDIYVYPLFLSEPQRSNGGDKEFIDLNDGRKVECLITSYNDLGWYIN